MKNNIRSKKKIIKPIFIYLCGALVILYSIAPIIFLIRISVSEDGGLPNSLFDHKLEDMTLKYWGLAMEKDTILRAAFNSISISLIVTVIVTFVSILAGYSLSRWISRRGQNAFYVILVFRMMPAVGILIPFFLFVKYVGLTDTIWGPIIGLIPMNITFAIWLMKGYIEGVPRELEEAAWIEGASIFQTLIRIIIPLATPGIGVTALLTFLTSYMDYIFAVTVVRKSAITLPIEVSKHFLQTTVNFQFVAVTALISIVPIIILYSIFRKVLTSGVQLQAGFK